MLRIVSGIEKKAFDRGGLVWPLRSNAKDDGTASKRKTLIEAAPFGRLDQMLRTTVQGRVSGGFAPQLKTDSPGFSKTKPNERKKNENKIIIKQKNCFHRPTFVGLHSEYTDRMRKSEMEPHQ